MLPTVASWSADPCSTEEAAALADALGLAPATAAILCRRGLGEPDAARAFLAAAERHDPELLGDMEQACALILDHARRESPIVVFGDYDVDGVCATAIMVSALRAVGARAHWRLPSRDEGYGLNEAVVRELAAAGAGLIVTVDCGVTAAQEVALAQELGVAVVVTDHHRPGAQLPPCSLVHPGLGGYPFDGLCGAAVAFKLSEALRTRAGLDPAGAETDLDLAGLATLADMVPLRDESRRLAREGLAAIARTRRPGLLALMRVAALDPGEVDERAVGFRLGPRINAAGRLQRADAALELLLTEDEERAGQIAAELDALNADRRESERRILHEADKACATQLSAAAIVVAGEGWHPGVVGIVASRLVERHRRPCVVIALDGATGRGSGRSIAAYDLHAGIAAASGRLLRFGGHRMAAGLEIAADQVAAFRAELAAHAGARLAPADLVRVATVDAVVDPGSLTLELAEELERLGPFGASNPAPTLLVPAARIEHVTAMGAERKHARFSVAGGGARARGVAFGVTQAALAKAGADPHDVALSLERNRWNGSVEARIVLRSMVATRPGRLVEVAAQPALTDAVATELDADPAAWWPGNEVRTRDRRGAGFAGVAGEILASGERALVVVADVARRRGPLERLIAGMAPAGLAVIDWTALAAQPALAAAYDDLILLDPPPLPGLLIGGAGLVHLCWGETERAFTLACWRERLSLRPALIDVWRTLELRGTGAYPRDGATCGRIVRVLTELGLATWDGAALQRAAGERTELERSPAYRAYMERLAQVERHLGAAQAHVAAASA